MKSSVSNHRLIFALFICLAAMLALHCDDDLPPTPLGDDPVDSIIIPASLVGIWRLDSTCDSTGCAPPDTTTDIYYMQLRSEGTYCPHNLETAEGCASVAMVQENITGTSFKVGQSHYYDVISLTDSSMRLANWVVEQSFIVEYYHRED